MMGGKFSTIDAFWHLGLPCASWRREMPACCNLASDIISVLIDESAVAQLLWQPIGQRECMRKLVWILPLLTGVFWGITGLFVRSFHAAGMDNATILLARALFVPPILLVGILIVNRKYLFVRVRDLWVFFCASVTGTFLLNLCYNEAINTLSLSLATILLSLAPVFVVAIAAVLFREKVTARKVVCMIAAFAGCALASGIFDNSGLSWSVRGILAGLASAVFYAVYSVFTKIAATRGYHGATITFYCFTFLVVVLIPFADWGKLVSYAVEAPLANVSLIVGAAVCTSAVPFVLYAISLKYMDAGTAAIITDAADPVTATLCGLVAFQEIPSILQSAGLVLTIAALSVLVRDQSDSA